MKKQREFEGNFLRLFDAMALIKERVDNGLEQFSKWPDFPPKLAEATRYSLLAKGKRFRAFLICLGAALGQEKSLCHIEIKGLLEGACAIEMIHAYSLIHDDLPCMDDDDFRRGLPTNHKVYGEALALLAGDALLTQAFSLLVQGLMAANLSNGIQIVGEIADAVGGSGMVGGQVLDLEGEKKSLDLEGLKMIHRGKTGALIQISVLLGGHFARLSAEKMKALSEYGALLGLLFQITDDILDEVGDFATLGKKPGSDKAQGKNTFISILGLEGARSYAQEVGDMAVGALGDLRDPDDFARLLPLYLLDRNS